MHEIMVSSTFYDEMYGMSPNRSIMMMSPYVRNVSLNDYVMKVLHGMSEVLILSVLMYEFNYMVVVSW